MKKAFIGVYGCQMNISDAERMEGQLKTIGYERVEEMEDADLILLNTCCVRETAEDKVYGKIGEIKHPLMKCCQALMVVSVECWRWRARYWAPAGISTSSSFCCRFFKAGMTSFSSKAAIFLRWAAERLPLLVAVS